MYKHVYKLSVCVPLVLSACSMTPTGPSVMVLPGTNKNFSQFNGDDMQCRQYALQLANGHSPSEAGAASGIAAAAIGTAVGAAAGAAIGGGGGAAVGAGVGLATGSIVGAGVGSSVGSSAQERYDIAYIQCMYSSGHRVPVYGNMQSQGLQSGTQGMPPQQDGNTVMSLPPANYSP